MKLNSAEYRKLIIFGLLLGFIANFFATYHYLLIIQPLLNIVWIFSIALIFYLRAFEMRDIRRNPLKTRVFFIGISLSSFLFTFWDFFQFYALGQHYIAVSHDPPYIMLGGVPLPSLLFSLALGSLFGLMERLVEIKK
jgi:hypothetical protein